MHGLDLLQLQIVAAKEGQQDQGDLDEEGPGGHELLLLHIFRFYDPSAPVWQGEGRAGLTVAVGFFGIALWRRGGVEVSSLAAKGRAALQTRSGHTLNRANSTSEATADIVRECWRGLAYLQTMDVERRRR